MRIGKDGYDVPGYNPEEEEQIRIDDEVEKDWEDCDEKEEILAEYYPDRIGIDDIDQLYEGLGREQKLEIFLERNPEKGMTPNDYPH